MMVLFSVDMSPGWQGIAEREILSGPEYGRTSGNIKTISGSMLILGLVKGPRSEDTEMDLERDIARKTSLDGAFVVSTVVTRIERQEAGVLEDAAGLD